ncbi:hypothetical protein MESS2_1000039 [Mesorhizobium metallidurans STM 2683]|uniref:Uncharacterized protein n=1 Tax=Mesorhizobium metallidurans STM 2683 TaxID=1297569 RepID=M5EFG7_9HYPH|nr:hypothetical protein MESS2_1000039 [Mesorhizobium metallidurans STM 2683]
MWECLWDGRRIKTRARIEERPWGPPASQLSDPPLRNLYQTFLRCVRQLRYLRASTT